MKTDPRYPHLHIVDHPLVQHKLTLMREKSCSTKDFRILLKEITMLMGYELTRDTPLTTRRIETPVAPMRAPVIAGKKDVIVPVLRAGLGMSDGLLALMPSARVGHIGLYRDEETFEPHEYYCKLPSPVEYLVRMPPELKNRRCIIVDPMLATGNSSVHAVNVLLKRGAMEDNIKFLALVAAPEGVEVFFKAHPNIDLYVASVDEKLDKNAYIVPGLGDAGDRIFGTL